MEKKIYSKSHCLLKCWQQNRLSNIGKLGEAPHPNGHYHQLLQIEVLTWRFLSKIDLPRSQKYDMLLTYWELLLNYKLNAQSIQS